MRFIKNIMFAFLYPIIYNQGAVPLQNPSYVKKYVKYKKSLHILS